MQILPKHAFLFLRCGFGNRRSKKSHGEEGEGGLVGIFGYGADRPGVTPSYFCHLLPTKLGIFLRVTNVLEIKARSHQLLLSLHHSTVKRWHSGETSTGGKHQYSPPPSPRSHHPGRWQPAGPHNDTLYLFDCPPQLTAAHLNASRDGSKGRDGGPALMSSQLTIPGIDL